MQPPSRPVGARALSTPVPGAAPNPPEPIARRPPKPPLGDRGGSGGSCRGGYATGATGGSSGPKRGGYTSAAAESARQGQQPSDRRPNSQRSAREDRSNDVPSAARAGPARTCSLPPLRDRARKEPTGPASEPSSAEAPKTRRRAMSVRKEYVGAVDGGRGLAAGTASAPSGTRSAPPRLVDRSTSSQGNAQMVENSAVKRVGFSGALQEWKKRRGHPMDARVFSISGAFPGIKKALLERGWVENTDASSPLWDLRYAMLLKDIGELTDLDDQQAVNFFGRNSEISSKIGMCNNIYNSCTLGHMAVDEFLPRCYDLTSTTQIEAFVQDFKATSCACIVHRFLFEGGRTADSGTTSGFPRSVVRVALAVCQRRCRSIDDTLDGPCTPIVTDEEWRALELYSLKKPGKRLKPWKGQVPLDDPVGGEPQPTGDKAEGVSAALPPNGNDDGAASDASDNDGGNDGSEQANNAKVSTPRCAEDEALFHEASEVLPKLRRLLPQFGLDGFQNIWILKPAGKSRGRGIQLSARLEKILEIGVGRGIESRWIAQKYMENPQIINQKKFDIRQWAVVTKWDPLSVWFYEDCYLRFSFSDYDPSKLKNRYSHLTNNSVSKHAKDFDEKQDETMWHSDEYRAHLASLQVNRNGEVIKDPWLEVVQPKIKAMVWRSLESVQDVVQPRSSSFQLFGYDFMVSDDLEAWLIEVNSSPDLSYSTSTTRGLVKAMLDDLVRVAVDVEKFGIQVDRPKRKWDKLKADTGRFVLLEPARRRREERFGKMRKAKGSGQLEIRGAGIKLRKPKRGESVGPDAAPDPRVVDAAQLAERLAEEECEHGAAPGEGAGSEDGDDGGERSDDEGSDASSAG